MADALALAAQLERDGVGSAIDFFGEQVGDSAAAIGGRGRLCGARRRAHARRLEGNVAIDLSHVGLDVSPDFCRAQLERIVAALGGRRLDVGAEDSARTSSSQAIVLELARQGAPLQMTLQANLHRSASDWPRSSRPVSAIRLVKGAYVEAAAHRYGEETDLAFLRLARSCTRRGADVTLATHDPILREALIQLGDPVEISRRTQQRHPGLLVERARFPYGVHPCDGTGPLLDAPHRGIPGRLTARRRPAKAELPADAGC